MAQPRVFLKDGAGWSSHKCPNTDTTFKIKRHSSLQGTLQIWDKETLLDSWLLTTDEQRGLFHLLSKPYSDE